MLNMNRGGFLGGPVTATVLAAGATGADLTLSTTLAVTGASTLTGDIAAGNINMASGKVLKLDAGSSSAAALQFSNSAAGTGMYASAADAFSLTRSGTAFFTINSAGITSPTTFTVSASTILGSTLRVSPETVKTVNYQVTNTDTIVFMNGTGLTATLPATGATSQLIWIKNNDAGTCTVARNGSTIDGAAADITLASKEACFILYTGSEWFRLNNIP